MKLKNLLMNGVLAGALALGSACKDSPKDITPVKVSNFASEAQNVSLDYLVRDIVSKEDSKEVAAQKLLDFVSTNIAYNVYNGNYTKSAVQVLSDKEADCRGKTLLYSSLLNSAGIDNLVVYYPGHVSVAVAGNHPNRNGKSFFINDVRYSLADPSFKDGFKIGETENSEVDLSQIKYIRPSLDNSLMLDFTGK